MIPPTSADVAGDINHDGYPDLIVGYANLIAFHNEIKIFLDGPDADSIPDIYLENLDIPGGQTDFGATVAGIGDFNGDGIDDFAVRSRTADGPTWMAEVNCFAGWDSDPTDVKDQYNPIMPELFYLHPNHPNPFNSSTTISFNIPRHDQITLSIYDITGRKLRTLIDNTLSAGAYSVIWDSRNSHGDPVSTGIYLCRLKSSSQAATRKLLLLK